MASLSENPFPLPRHRSQGKNHVARWLRNGTWAAFLLAACLSAVVTSAQAQSQRLFPVMEARDLTDAERRLPSGLPTDPTLVVVAFEEEQQPQADRLLSLIGASKARALGIAVIETPVIEDPGSVARLFIDRGMKNGIPDLAKRQAVITLFVPKLAAWLGSVGLPSKANVHLLAVARDGRILLKASAAELADVKAIDRFLAALPRR